jgi:hypothetical protein
MAKKETFEAILQAAHFEIRQGLLEIFEPGNPLRDEIINAISNGAYRAVYEMEQKRSGVED